MADPGKTDLVAGTEIDTTAKKRNLIYYVAGTVALITFTLYLSSLGNEFVNWDDNEYVLDNPNIRSLNLSFLKWAFFDFYAANWHPLTWISHALDYAVWGSDPFGHHLTNNILHAINTFLVVLLVVRLMEVVSRGEAVPRLKRGRFTESPLQKNPSLTGVTNQFSLATDTTVLIAAGVTGLLFGLHPIHVESVAWVAERKDLLCALFFLLSIMMYTRYITPPASPPPLNLRGGRGSYLISLALFTLALLSKPMAVSLPVVLLILDWYPFARITTFRTFKTAFIEKLPFIFLSLVSSILTMIAQSSSMAIRSLEFASLSARLLSAVNALIAYLYKIFLPLKLLPFYPYPLHISNQSGEYFLSIVLTVGITTVCFVLAQKKEFLWFCLWTYYLVTLLPVLGIVQVGDQSMADRYMYLPSLAPLLFIGLLTARVWEKVNTLIKWRLTVKLVCAGTAIFVLSAISYLTYRQTAIWHNSFTLWTYVIEKEPAAVPAAYNNRGIAFGKIGKLDRAILDFDRAIVLHPSFDRAYNNRGSAYLLYGHLDKAIEDFDKAININTENPSSYNNRGYAYYLTGRYDRAIHDYNKTIELDQNFAKAYLNRGNLYFTTGNNELAISDLQKACYLGEQEGCNALQTLSMKNQMR